MLLYLQLTECLLCSYHMHMAWPIHMATWNSGSCSVQHEIYCSGTLQLCDHTAAGSRLLMSTCLVLICWPFLYRQGISMRLGSRRA